MVTGAKIGYGTTLSWGTPPVAVVELTRIGAVTLSVSKVDSTTLGSATYYKEILPGLIDPGDVAIEGLFRPDDPGQYALLTDMEQRISRAFTIAFPTALSTTTWTGTAYITGFVAGDATPEGIIPFSATLSIVGRPTLNVTAVVGPTNIVVNGDITIPIEILPVYAANIYIYSCSGLLDNTFTITVTVGGAQIITINGNTYGSGVPSAIIDTVPDEIITNTVVISEALKSSKTYTIYVVDGKA